MEPQPEPVGTDRVLRQAFPSQGLLSLIAVRLVESKHLGQKTGSGVYKYDVGDHTPHDSEHTQAVSAAARGDAGYKARDFPAAVIADRLVTRMIAEAGHVLREQLVDRESDIDAATLLGVGFPSFRGGG